MGFVDDVIMGEPGSSKIDISALVIDLSEQLPDPQPIVRIWGNLIASRGNVSTVVGLAKSWKTFLTAAVASGFLSSSDFLGFDTPATGKVVYIDTEQARAHGIRLPGGFYEASACRPTTTTISSSWQLCGS